MSFTVAEKIQFFEQKRAGRVIMAGHGIFRMGDPAEHEDDEVEFDGDGTHRGFKMKKKGTKTKKKKKAAIPSARLMETGKAGTASLALGHSGKFSVPLGMSIYFYCKHGDTTSDEVCKSIEGFSFGKPSQPVEVIKGGQLCYNYRLRYARGLKLNMTEVQATYEVITIPESRVYAAVPLTTLLHDSRCDGATEIHWCACREVVLNQLNWRNELLFASAQHKADFDYQRQRKFTPVRVG